MTTFEDGPAKGQKLMLKRAARFIRVTAIILPESGEVKKWDALDQLEDCPKFDETLYAYEITGQPGWSTVCVEGGRGGIFAFAQYRFVHPQPIDADMRYNDRWTDWCRKKAGM